MYQRVMYGEITHEENRHLSDLSPHEIALLVPVVLMIVWIGVYPYTFLRPMDASTAHLLEQMQVQKTMIAQPCEGMRQTECGMPNVTISAREERRP
jgi:NADH-quinone oxidoreductase subunit M